MTTMESIKEFKELRKKQRNSFMVSRGKKLRRKKCLTDYQENTNTNIRK